MKKIWAALIATTLFACSGDGSVDSQDNGLVEVLEIEVHGDSWTQLARRQIARPVAVAVGEGVAGTTHAISYICAGRPLKVWDQTNFVGNLLCISGAGNVNLAKLDRGVGGNWEASIRSYQTGSEFGRFKQRLLIDGGFEEGPSSGFCRDESRSVVHSVVSAAYEISLPSLSLDCF